MSLSNGCANSNVSEWCDICETLDVGHGRVLDSDIFTQNLDGQLFDKFAQVYFGVNKYRPDIPSREGVKR